MYQTISHYRVIEPLGSGGAGHVWKAEDLKLKRTVAIKFLAADLDRDEEAKKRLEREAQMAAALTHPNIATVYEVIEAGEQFYMVMECVEGETLKSRVGRGPLGVNASLEVAIQVADALKAAHARGLVHCDIKSSNIMLTAGGQAKVLDFGLARIVAATKTGPSREVVRTRKRSEGIGILSERESVQGSTVISGTPGYMSPEQVRGETLDGRTDIFSLGVVLYEMLTARSPFHGGRPVEVLHSVLNDEPPSLSAVCDDAPLELESIVRRALAKGRDERYAAAADLLSDLRALKHQLENREAAAASFIEGAGSASTPSDATSLERDRARSLRRVAWRYRRWLLAGSVFAASMAVLDIISLEPHGAKWAQPAALLACAVLFALGYAAARQKAPRPLQAIPSGAAFRGLLPFQDADRDRFYGRETDTTALFEMIRHSDCRFGVLFGESGCGKTSLLRAGLLPKLWEEGYLPIFCRSYKDPLAAALEECRKRSQLKVLENESPTEYLGRVAREIGATLVIVCDQFEEFFVSHKSKEEREPFLSFIATSHDDSDLPVKFLVSMRSDFLYLISLELGGRIAEPLISSRLFHLRNFDEEQAIEIIEKSAHRGGLPFEAGLSRHVARDLASGDVVSPSEMQIVGEQLQSKRIYTLQAYRRAGGKEPLVHSFLEDVIQASGDADGARLLLRSIISEENTRLTLTADDIARRTQRSAAGVEQLLRSFVNSRLIREIQDDTPWRYELMHEYLIEKINQVTGRVMDATQRANRLFRQYVSNYSVDKRTRIPISKLWFIRRYSDLQRGERERELFRKSLRRGLFKTAALVLLLAGGTALAAAALSVREEWQEVRLKDGHTAAVRKALFSSDGRLLVSCGEDGKVIVWDFARRERIATLTDHTSWVTALAFSPDGKWFATGGDDQKVIVWDAAQLKKAVVLSEHQAPVNTLAFSPDGRWLASASGRGGGRVIVWDTARWEKVYELPRDVVWGDIIFSPDGRRALISNEIWDLASASLIKVVDPGWRYGATSPDGRRLVVVDSLGTVKFYDSTRLWDQAEAKVISGRSVHSYHGRTVAFSPDGRLAASGADDIVLWDAATQTMLSRFNYSAQVWRLAFSPDGRWLVSSHDDGAILVWDVAERKQVASLNEHAGSVHAVAFSPDGKQLASAGEDRSVIVWDTELGEKEAVLNGHASRVTAVAFSPDAKWVASTDMDSNLAVWDLAERKPRWTNRYLDEGKDSRPSYCLAFSPDGRWVVNSSAVYDSTDGRQVLDYKVPSELTKTYEGNVYGVAFSPDGRWMIGVTDQSAIFLCDAETWQAVEGAKLSITPIISVSFSPDGKQFVTGDDDGVVRLWEMSPIRQVAVIGRHAARIKSVAFSPDGSEVASAGDDQMIALWDVKRRSLITRIGLRTSPVLSVAFSPDGKRLASGEHDRSVRIYTRHRKLWGYRLGHPD
ncbi:MAG: protein kinase [Acidobacteriota bacterium]